MPIKVTCPRCGKVIHVAEKLAGKRGRCPACQTTVQVPSEARDSAILFADVICSGCGKIFDLGEATCDVCGTSLQSGAKRSGMVSRTPPKVQMRNELPDLMARLKQAALPPPDVLPSERSVVDKAARAPLAPPAAPPSAPAPQPRPAAPASAPPRPGAQADDVLFQPTPPPHMRGKPKPFQAQVAPPADDEAPIKLEGLGKAPAALPAPPRAMPATAAAPAEVIIGLDRVPAETGPPVRPGSRTTELEIMVTTIQKQMDDLRKQVETSKELKQSLEEARKQQLQMLPKTPEIENYQFASIYEPSHIIGGDFYHFLDVSPGELGIAIGDISGHGLEAALVVGLVKKVLELHGAGCSSPADVLRWINADVMPDLQPKTFITMFYGVLDLKTRMFRYSRAGHNPLIVYNPQRQKTPFMLSPKGMVLGMDRTGMFEKRLQEEQLQLVAGDLLVQYTDGVVETMNESREEFGMTRFLKLIERHGAQPAEFILEQLRLGLKHFRGQAELADDVTAVVMRVL